MSFNFEFKQSHLEDILHGNPYVEQWYNALCTMLPDYEITSVKRVAAFRWLYCTIRKFKL